MHERVWLTPPSQTIHIATQVGCFGTSLADCYIKSLLSVGLKLPQRAALVSIGGMRNKVKAADLILSLNRMGFQLYGTQDTALFMERVLAHTHSSVVNCSTESRSVSPTIEQRGAVTGSAAPPTPTPTPTGTQADDPFQFSPAVNVIRRREVDLVINIPSHDAKSAQGEPTLGFRIRRTAVENDIALFSDLKCAYLFTRSMEELGMKAAAKGKAGAPIDVKSVFDIQSYRQHMTLRGD
jgi:hypothetical protein